MKKDVIKITLHNDKTEVSINGTFEQIANGMALISMDFLKNHQNRELAIATLNGVLSVAIKETENAK